MNKYRGMCRQLGDPVVSTECCSGTLSTVTTSLPESLRIRNQLCAPYVYIPPGRSSTLCLTVNSPISTSATDSTGTTGTTGATGTTGTSNTTTALNTGFSFSIEAPVLVRSVAASETTALLGIQTVNAATNRNNPDTRFQQYFPEQPPIPMSKICPERYPNPAPVRDRFCVPQGTFAPSVPQ